MNEKIKSYLLPAACIVAAIVLIVVGFSKYQNTKVFKPATATITEIEEEYTGIENNEYEYTVHIRFELDGQKIDTFLDTYVSTMKTGDKVDILYNPEKPTEVQSAGSSNIFVPILIGIVSLAVGIFLIVRQVKTKVE